MDNRQSHPPLTWEDRLLSALLDMVRQHCGAATADSLDSMALSANAAAMRLLAEAGLIEIESEFLRRVFAHELPAAWALDERVEAVTNRNEGASGSGEAV